MAIKLDTTKKIPKRTPRKSSFSGLKTLEMDFRIGNMISDLITFLPVFHWILFLCSLETHASRPVSLTFNSFFSPNSLVHHLLLCMQPTWAWSTLELLMVPGAWPVMTPEIKARYGPPKIHYLRVKDTTKFRCFPSMQLKLFPDSNTDTQALPSMTPKHRARYDPRVPLHVSLK